MALLISFSTPPSNGLIISWRGSGTEIEPSWPIGVGVP